MRKIQDVSVAHTAVETGWLELVRRVLVAAEMLPSAVEIRIEDLTKRLTIRDANPVRAAIHDLRHVDEWGAQLRQRQNIIVAAVWFVLRRIAWAEALILNSEVKRKSLTTFPETAFARKNQLAAFCQIGVQLGFQLVIDANVVGQNDGLVGREIHRAVNETE